jgi:nicotinamidase-related amidase
MKLSTLVDPATTVILTQECQRGIIGDLQPGFLRGPAEEVGLVKKVNKVVTAGRDAGCHVLHCVAELRTNHPAFGTNAPIFHAGKRNEARPEWDPRCMEIVDGIEVAETDLTSARAVNPSPIIGTEVPTLLRNLGAKTVVAVGVSANLGIPMITFDCVGLGYSVVIPRDAIVGTPLDYADVLIKNTLSFFAKICTVDDLVEAWSGA